MAEVDAEHRKTFRIERENFYLGAGPEPGPPAFRASALTTKPPRISMNAR